MIARIPGVNHLDRAYRNTLFQEYGAFTTSLRGIYYTAEDVGVHTIDMAEVCLLCLSVSLLALVCLPCCVAVGV